MEPMTRPRDLALPAAYSDLLGQLKEYVRAARSKALRTVNTQLMELWPRSWRSCEVLMSRSL